MIRFIQQFDLGSGDYTKERNEIFKNYTFESIVDEIKNMKKEDI